jgi:hypothetical protein
MLSHSCSHLVAHAAAPMHEPVVAFGPFVMNAAQETERAIPDYPGGQVRTDPRLSLRSFRVCLRAARGSSPSSAC